ncbi:MAG: CoA transferase [Deltaproteobacteria bacterium]|nr:CoA transferase [Deltaproteobacteria bacterium]MBW2052079.1 CoA transferase [Deltaproteobacteria bacterium]MBW2140700.1 CoA transferase [Deltaproteobacteria bacterium]MBW2322338.1 CoA transferase [Deltaproteobacteria bacterium]
MGPLNGVRIIEIAGIGPGPFCAMMLADMGADIIRVERMGQYAARTDVKYQVLNRGRRSVAMDLKKPEGVESVLKLIETADALFEGFRPGVMERLGLGPDVCLERNPRLVYGRMTGWGQEGPLSKAAGHDINYIATTGALGAIGRQGGNPVPPLNLVGDFGGGGMLLAFGIACALYETQKSGQGQVVDAAMVDGSAALMAMFYGLKAGGAWIDQLGKNFLDTGSHFYDTYETSDGKWVAVGSIEPQFYALLLKHTGIDDPGFQQQMDRTKWPKFKEKMTAVFKTKTRDEWCEIMEGTDVCFAPVLSMNEAMAYPHNVARNTFVEIDGVPQQAPAPRFSRTKPEIQGPPPTPGEHTESALRDWGLSSEEIKSLKEAGAI